MVVVLVVSGLAYWHFAVPGSPNACQPLDGKSVLKSTISTTNRFGAVTEYDLPSPSRWSNAITVAQDGSVWFGEQSVPGVGHLYANGTLVEYAWPWTNSQATVGSCDFKTSIWGIAVWNGMVWATDGDQNALVGLNPDTGALRIVNVSGLGSFPYTLTAGPDGDLWFTMLAPAPAPAVICRMAPDYQASAFQVAGYVDDIPTQVQFVNSTYAYYAALNLSSTSGAGGVFSFNPLEVSSGINPTPVGPDFRLVSPNSLSVSNGTVWVTQHGAASIASYNSLTGEWNLYPTSTENYTDTTLPYFVQSVGSRVWFNEHYGNKIAMLSPSRGTLTEYSEVMPPIYNGSEIGNDLTIAATNEGLWFTSVTGNYVGFVNASYKAGFSVSAVGASSITLARGQDASVQFLVNGTRTGLLRVQVSDTENFTAVPEWIMMVPDSLSIAAGSGAYALAVHLSVSSEINPGRYTLAVTVTDGLVYQSAYLFLTVTR